MKSALCAVFLLVSPVFATIAQQRNAFNWSCSGTTNVTTGQITCQAIFTSTGANDLIAVWTTWQTASGTPNTLTASVADTQHNGTGTPAVFPSAVGPTLQSAASNPTAAQIFYAANIHGTTNDTITVTLQGPIPGGTSVPSFGVVIAEYSGLDQNNPLDSVSAGYSTLLNPTALLDSGTASPANGNLLVLGGGTTDTGNASLIINSPFAVIQKSGGSITEQMIVSPSLSLPQGNNTLQRAQASSSAGNWLMQMAVFRDASWTVSGAWSPARPAQIRYADQFPGSDCGAKIYAADADLGVSAGEIWVNNACGMAIKSAVTISANHTVRFIQAGTYTYCGLWTLGGNGISIVGPPTGMVEDINGPPQPALILEQGSGCNLNPSFLVKGASVAIQGITINGNSSGNGSGEVGILTDTSAGTITNSRGRLLLSDVSIGNFSGDNIQITSSPSTNQAIHAELDYVATSRAGGNGITVTDTTDVKIHRLFSELNSGYGLQITSSAVWVDTSDLSTNNTGGIYVAGNPAQTAGLSIAHTSVASPSCTVSGKTACTSASVNGGVVVQGYDLSSNTCENASLTMIDTAFSVTGGTASNFWDMIHIENSGGNVIQSSKFLGPAVAPMARYGYFHANTKSACGTLFPDVIGTGDEFVGSFGTTLFSFLAADVIAGNLEIGNSGFTQSRLVNFFLPNAAPLFCGNAAATPEPCLHTDSSNNTTITGDPTAGVIVLQPHGGGANILSATNSGVSINGNLNVTGTLTKGSGSFKIDHPLDPANKYLYHSFVESPDMMNIYNGNVVLDINGEAEVPLPYWFEALNRDFRYQLTCIGGFAPIYVSQEINNSRFRIAGGIPGVKVSWQVTGIRHDAYANAHRIQVEEEKPVSERGRYLHPELFGASEVLGGAAAH